MDQVDEVLDELRDQLASKDAEIAGLRAHLRGQAPGGAATDDAVDSKGRLGKGRCGNAGACGAGTRPRGRGAALTGAASGPGPRPAADSSERTPAGTLEASPSSVVTIALSTAAARLWAVAARWPWWVQVGGDLCGRQAGQRLHLHVGRAAPGRQPMVPGQARLLALHQHLGRPLVRRGHRQWLPLNAPGRTKRGTCRKTPGRSIRSSRCWDGRSRPPRASSRPSP